jgi:hypothetical protein
MKPTTSRFKTCTQCKARKPISEFNYKRRVDEIRHSYCRDCGKKITQSHYKRRKRLYLDRNLRAYRERRNIVITAKSQPCADCGVQYPYYVMDLDHREGVIKQLSLHAVHRVSKRAVLLEIEKCDVVCSNCHRERTQRRKAWKQSEG